MKNCNCQYKESCMIPDNQGCYIDKYNPDYFKVDDVTRNLINDIVSEYRITIEEYEDKNQLLTDLNESLADRLKKIEFELKIQIDNNLNLMNDKQELVSEIINLEDEKEWAIKFLESIVNNINNYDTDGIYFQIEEFLHEFKEEKI